MTNPEALREMQVPIVYRGISFETFDPTMNKWNPKVIERIKQAAEKRRWIVICGEPSGVGKTMLAVSVLLELWLKDEEIKTETFCNYDPDHDPDYGEKQRVISHEHRSTFGYRFLSLRRLRLLKTLDEKQAVFAEAARHKVLLLDEMGRNPGDWINELIDELTFSYFEDGKIIIGTSSLPRSSKRVDKKRIIGFRDYYDGSIIRRIEEFGEIIEFNRR